MNRIVKLNINMKININNLIVNRSIEYKGEYEHIICIGVDNYN